jgi:hypothetical protein
MNTASQMRNPSHQDQSFCVSYQAELGAMDEDPNGEQNATCAKCRAEENHDFDAKPNAQFARSGARIK